MFEGHDTTATGVTWVLHLLGCYPHVQERVHREIADVCGASTEVTMEQLGRLKYLECCIKVVVPSVMLLQSAHSGSASSASERPDVCKDSRRG